MPGVVCRQQLNVDAVEALYRLCKYPLWVVRLCCRVSQQRGAAIPPHPQFAAILPGGRAERERQAGCGVRSGESNVYLGGRLKHAIIVAPVEAPAGRGLPVGHCPAAVQYPFSRLQCSYCYIIHSRHQPRATAEALSADPSGCAGVLCPYRIVEVFRIHTHLGRLLGLMATNDSCISPHCVWSGSSLMRACSPLVMYMRCVMVP